jgi:hypothetical protein
MFIFKQADSMQAPSNDGHAQPKQGAIARHHVAVYRVCCLTAATNGQ